MHAGRHIVTVLNNKRGSKLKFQMHINSMHIGQQYDSFGALCVQVCMACCAKYMKQLDREV